MLTFLSDLFSSHIQYAWWLPVVMAAHEARMQLEGKKSQEEADKKNARQQERFAREGIRWKVQDAKAAGIAPEFALGASTYQASPTHTPTQSDSAIAGQSIARAALATASQPDRDMTQALQAETLRGMRLDNDIKQTQGMTQTQYASNPAFPHARGNVIEGQGNSPVKDVPLERTGMSRSRPDSEGGSIPSVGWSKTADGGLRPVPSQDIKNRIEDQLIPETVWAAQNLVAPNIGKGPRPPEEALPKGAHMWRWSTSRQAWYPDNMKTSKNQTKWFKQKFKSEYGGN